MLSFKNCDVYEYGPQHSTPIKGQEAFLSKKQRAGNNVHLSKIGRVTPHDVDINNQSPRAEDITLLQYNGFKQTDISNKQDFTNNDIDISKISVIQNTSDVNSTYRQDDDKNIASAYSEPPSSLSGKHTLNYQNNHPVNHRLSQTPGRLDQKQSFGRDDAGRYFHHCRRDMPSDCVSDSDTSKQSQSPKTTYRYEGSPEMSYGNETFNKDRPRKGYRKGRPSSAPRLILGDVNICSRDYNLPSYSLTDFGRAPSVYIEQDIINKQRQEIQLLMEELGNRDQELNDLVMSHQKQVKAWESDNEKFVVLQSRISQYEDELRSREDQLKETLSEMAQVNEQREVDALELKQTQNEMIKLAERIMENSVYIKEMETQNQKLSYSLREFVSARKAFNAREEELLLTIEEKKVSLIDKQRETDKLSEHIKYLECQCEELGEKNNNTAVESINWKKKYFQVKEEADRLTAECKTKEENAQKMTQQLHESLQQAIALQKALFTSCEREKCKEEVMYSLRKQHKRTMQELQNIRELYDRLSRDQTLYHLSVKDKDNAKDGKKKDDDVVESKARKSKGDDKFEEDVDKRRQESRRKHESNISSQKLKHHEGNEESFLVKETKERKPSKDEKSEQKNTVKTSEKSIRNGEKNIGYSDEKNRSYKKRADESDVNASLYESVSQARSQRLLPKQHSSTSSKPAHTPMYRNIATITSSTSMFSNEARQRVHNNKQCYPKKVCCGESSCNQVHLSGFGNTSRNADCPSNSRISTAKSVQSRTTSPFSIHEELGHCDKPVGETTADKDRGGDSSSDVSHIVSPSQFDDELTPADSDGMCYELKRDISRIDSEHLDRLSPMPETSILESRRSRTPTNSLPILRKSSFLRKDKAEKKTQYIPNDVSPLVLKHNVRKKAVEFDATNEDLTKSASMETHSQYLEPESESYCPSLPARQHSSLTRANFNGHTKTSFNYQTKNVSPVGKKEKASLNVAESSDDCNHLPGRTCNQETDRCQDSENEQKTNGEDCNRITTLGNPRGQNLVENSNRWDTGCSECQDQGKSFGNCSIVPISCSAFPNMATNEIDPDLSKNDVRYSCHAALMSASSKLSFNEIDSLLEYNSSLSKSQSHHLQSAEQGKFQSATPDEINSQAFRLPDQKSHFNSLINEPIHDLNIASSKFHTFTTDNLPERISTYLAKHLSAKKKMYNNNNSRLVDQLNFDLSSKCEIPEKGSQMLKFDHNTQSQESGSGYEFVDSERESLQDVSLFSTNNQDVQDPRVSKTNQRETARDGCVGRGTERDWCTERGAVRGCGREGNFRRGNGGERQFRGGNTGEVQPWRRAESKGKFKRRNNGEVYTERETESEGHIDRSNEKEPQKQTHTYPEERKNMCKDSTQNNDTEDSTNTCHTSVLVMEDMTHVIDKMHPLQDSLVGSTDLHGKVCNTQWRLDRAGQPGSVSMKPSSTGRSSSSQMSYICPEEPDSKSKLEKRCELKLLHAKGKKDAGFSQAPSVPHSTKALLSSSSKCPSLFRHLSQIHFSEKTRRYEWIKQTAISLPNKETTQFLYNGSHKLVSVNQYKLSELNISPHDCSFQDGATQDVVTRLDSQLSDSGHFSNSGVSSGHLSHNEKQVGHNTHKSNNNSCNMQMDRSENCQTTFLKRTDPNVPNKDFEQSNYYHNFNNNNNFYDASFFSKNDCSQSDECTSSQISHYLDSVVKRLDFCDTDLEESRVESGSHEISESAQCCFPIFGSNEDQISIGDISGISPSKSEWETAESESRVGVDVMGDKVKAQCDGCVKCGDNDHNFVAKNGKCINSKSINRENSVTSDNSKSINREHSLIRDNSKSINREHSLTNDNFKSVNLEHSLTSDNSKSIKLVHSLGSDSSESIILMHPVTSDSPKCINPVTNNPNCITTRHPVTADSPRCIDRIHPVTNDNSRCTNLEHEFTTGKPKCMNHVPLIIEDSPICSNLMCPVTKDSSRGVNKIHSVTKDNPRSHYPGHPITKDSCTCINPGQLVTNNNHLCINPTNSITNESPRCVNSMHSFTSDNPMHSFTSDNPMHSFTSDNPMHSVTSDNPMHSVTSDNPMHSVTSDNPMHSVTSDNSMHSVTSDNSRCSNVMPKIASDIPRHLAINNNEKCSNPEHSITDISPDSSSFLVSSMMDTIGYTVQNENFSEAPRPVHFQNTSEFNFHLSDEEEVDALSEKSEGNMSKLREGVVEKVAEIKDYDIEEVCFINKTRGNLSDVVDNVVDIESTDSNVQPGHNEIGGCYKPSLCSKYIPELGREHGNTIGTKKCDLSACLSVTENELGPLGPCHTGSQDQPEICLEDTRDSNTSVVCKVEDSWPVPAWVYENSVEETADVFDDTLAAFLEDSAVDNESLTGTQTSPVSKLYKLLLESQEMIHSLEQASEIPKTAEPEIFLVSGH